MKKLAFLTLAIIILFSAHQTYAVNNHANEKASNNPSSEKRNENSIKEENDEQEPADENENTPTVTEVDDNGEVEWKNHGQYVSSVAKTHPGGQVVSAAARSDIGKKNKGIVTPSVSPSVSPTILPSGTITPTPTEDPSATPSPTLTETPTPTLDPVQGLNEQLGGIIAALENLIQTLKNIFNL